LGGEGREGAGGELRWDGRNARWREGGGGRNVKRFLELFWDGMEGKAEQIIMEKTWGKEGEVGSRTARKEGTEVTLKVLKKK